MPKQSRIECLEGFIREVRLMNGSGLFSVEIEKLLSGGQWVRGGPSVLDFHLVEGIGPESVNRRVRVVIETLDETLEI